MASRRPVTAGVDRAGNVHRGGKRVVRRLRRVDVDWRLATQQDARELAAAVGDHLINVHVELGPAAGHPHVQREHVVVPASQDLVAGRNDQPVPLAVELTSRVIGIGRRLQRSIAVIISRGIRSWPMTSRCRPTSCGLNLLFAQAGQLEIVGPYRLPYCQLRP